MLELMYGCSPEKELLKQSFSGLQSSGTRDSGLTHPDNQTLSGMSLLGSILFQFGVKCAKNQWFKAI